MDFYWGPFAKPNIKYLLLQEEDDHHICPAPWATETRTNVAERRTTKGVLQWNASNEKLDN